MRHDNSSSKARMHADRHLTEPTNGQTQGGGGERLEAEGAEEVEEVAGVALLKLKSEVCWGERKGPEHIGVKTKCDPPSTPLQDPKEANTHLSTINAPGGRPWGRGCRRT